MNIFYLCIYYSLKYLDVLQTYKTRHLIIHPSSKFVLIIIQQDNKLHADMVVQLYNFLDF